MPWISSATYTDLQAKAALLATTQTDLATLQTKHDALVAQTGAALSLIEQRALLVQFAPDAPTPP